MLSQISGFLFFLQLLFLGIFYSVQNINCGCFDFTFLRKCHAISDARLVGPHLDSTTSSQSPKNSVEEN